MMNKNHLNIIPVFLLTGFLLFTACPMEPGRVIIDGGNGIEGNPQIGEITGTITLTDVPSPAPQVYISVSGGEGWWQSNISQINLDSDNYTDLSWSIPIYRNNYFSPSDGNFCLHIQLAGSDNGFDIYIQTQTPIYIDDENADVGSLGTVSLQTIILSGTINVTYNYETIPYVEIGADTYQHDWISYTRIDSPASDAPWSIKLPGFSSPTQISFRVIGYDTNNELLFNKVVYYEPSVYNVYISGIDLNLGNIYITPEYITELTADKWTHGEIRENGGIDWYSIEVTNGTKYYLWWNDSHSGDNTKTLDIDVYAYDNDIKLIPLKINNTSQNEKDNAWDTPVSFTASSTGKVYVRVRPLGGANSTGTYGIVYSAGSSRPVNDADGIEIKPIQLNAGEWRNSSMPSFYSGDIIWYAFHVTNGNTYYIWWNDSGPDGGDGSKTLDIKVNVYYSDESSVSTGASIFTEQDDAWSTPLSFKANSTGTVKLKVSPYFEGRKEGTFAIVYNRSNATRPIVGAGDEANPFPMSAGSWTNGEITETNTEIWYSLHATRGNTYYIWWNDSGVDGGDGSKTLDIKVDAYISDETYIPTDDPIFTEEDSAWDTSKPYSPRVTGSVKLKVTSSVPGQTGTFAIGYARNSTRP
jgi:hypothetical protein